MSGALLPWSNRIGLVLRECGGALAILAGVVAALAALGFRGFLMLVVTTGVPLALASDFLGIRSGAAVLWVQKPVAPLRYFTARLLERAVAGVVLVTVASTLIRVVQMIGGLTEPETGAGGIMEGSFMQALFVLVVVSMATGASVWLPRVGPTLAACLVGLTFALEVAGTLDAPLSPGRWLPWIRLLLVPWRSAPGVGEFAAVVPTTEAGVAVWSFAYCGAWVGIGVFGLRRALANGRLARARTP